MNQPVTTLPISKVSIEKLLDNGCLYCEDLPKVNSNLKNVDAEAQTSRTVEMKSALDYLKAEECNSYIPTMSQSLDAALGGGIKLGSLTEICGLPGSGKTQLCIQLCVTVQIPSEVGGLAGEAVYIDTASNFHLSRLKDMTAACNQRLGNNEEWAENVVDKVHFLEAFGIEKFCAALVLLEEFVANHSNIKLIIIDSIAFPFKFECTSIEQTGILYRMASKLRQIAMEKNIAIVLTNEMSTRIGIGVVGALGDAWAHCVGPRIIMAPSNAAVTHSSERVDAIAKIQILKDGIRDIR